MFFSVSGAGMLYFAAELLRRGVFGLRSLVICAAVVCLPMIAGAALLASAQATDAARRKTVRGALWALFAFYIFGLLGTLFFDRVDPSTYLSVRAAWLSNWDEVTNFTPFQTVLRYWRCFQNGVILSISRVNLIGNILLMAPMAVFLPLLFKSMRTFWKFLLLITALMCAIEALQLLLCCGVCDVDDVILNLIGALPVYGFLKLPPVRRRLEAWYLLPGTPEEEPKPAA